MADGEIHNAGSALVEALGEFLDGDVDECGEIAGGVIVALDELGFVIVPKLPTLEMILAGVDNNPTVFTKAEPGFARDVANDVYVCMVRTAFNACLQKEE